MGAGEEPACPPVTITKSRMSRGTHLMGRAMPIVSSRRLRISGKEAPANLALDEQLRHDGQQEGQSHSHRLHRYARCAPCLMSMRLSLVSATTDRHLYGENACCRRDTALISTYRASHSALARQ